LDNPIDIQGFLSYLTYEKGHPFDIHIVHLVFSCEDTSTSSPYEPDLSIPALIKNEPVVKREKGKGGKPVIKKARFKKEDSTFSVKVYLSSNK
jgi:hypothetical protein